MSVSFVKVNQYGLFEIYNNMKVKYHNKISCVDRDRLKSVLGNKPLVGSETGV